MCLMNSITAHACAFSDRVCVVLHVVCLMHVGCMLSVFRETAACLCGRAAGV